VRVIGLESRPAAAPGTVRRDLVSRPRPHLNQARSGRRDRG
jgi:hypothetical protein